MTTKKLMATLGALLTCTGVMAADMTWKADASGSYDGYIDDNAHWSRSSSYSYRGVFNNTARIAVTNAFGMTGMSIGNNSTLTFWGGSSINLFGSVEGAGTIVAEDVTLAPRAAKIVDFPNTVTIQFPEGGNGKLGISWADPTKGVPTCTVSSPITGTGTVEVATVTSSKTSTSFATYHLANDMSGFAGTFTQAGGSTYLAMSFDKVKSASPSASYTLNANGTRNANQIALTDGDTIAFGELKGTGKLVNNTTDVVPTIEVGALNTDFTCGINFDGLKVKKVGSGTMTLTGSNADLEVAEGKVVFDRGIKIKNFKVDEGATMEVTITDTTVGHVLNLLTVTDGDYAPEASAITTISARALTVTKGEKAEDGSVSYTATVNEAGTTLTWTGLGDGTTWNDVANWSPSFEPISGASSLVFPAGTDIEFNLGNAARTFTDVTVNGKVKVTSTSNNSFIANTLSGSGTLYASNAKLDIKTSLTNFTGTMGVEEGDSGTVIFEASMVNAPNTTFVLPKDSTWDLASYDGKDFYWGAVRGSFNLKGGNQSFTIGSNNANFDFGAIMTRDISGSSPMSITKVGTGTMTWSGTGTDNHGTRAAFNINGGKVIIASQASFDSMAIYVFGGGSIDVADGSIDVSSKIKNSTADIIYDSDYSTEWGTAIDKSNAGNLVKRGTSTLTLTKTPAFAGSIKVEEGAVILASGVTATLGENTAIQMMADGSKKLVPCTDAPATIDGVAYATVADALKAATTGKTVTLVDGAKLGSAVTLTDKGTVTLSASLKLDADLTLANTTLVIKGLTGAGKLVLDDSAIVQSSTDLTIETPVEVTASDDKMAKIQGTVDYVDYTFKGAFTGSGYVQFTAKKGSFKFQNDMREFEGTIDIPGDGLQRTVVNLSEYAYSEKAIWNIKNYDKDGKDDSTPSANLFVAGDNKTFYFGALNGNVRHNGNQSNNKLNTVVIGKKADSVLTGSFFNHSGYQNLVKDRGATIRKVGADTTLTYSGSSVRAYEVEEGTLKLTANVAVKVSWTDKDTSEAKAYSSPITIKGTAAKLVTTSDVTETPNVISGVTGYVVKHSTDEATGDTTYYLAPTYKVTFERSNCTIKLNGSETAFTDADYTMEAGKLAFTVTADEDYEIESVMVAGEDLGKSGSYEIEVSANTTVTINTKKSSKPSGPEVEGGTAVIEGEGKDAVTKITPDEGTTEITVTPLIGYLGTYEVPSTVTKITGVGSTQLTVKKGDYDITSALNITTVDGVTTIGDVKEEVAEEAIEDVAEALADIAAGDTKVEVTMVPGLTYTVSSGATIGGMTDGTPAMATEEETTLTLPKYEDGSAFYQIKVSK